MVIAEFFIPHGHCYLWKPELVGLHIVSDALTAVAYYSIPLMLVYFVVKRQDIPFNWIFLLFGAFIVSCGTTHIVEIWTLWHPDYWLSGSIKAFTAVVSLYTASELVSLLPQALTMPSAAQFEAVKTEIQERLRTEAELQQAIAQLKQEMAERQQAEEALRESEERLHLALEGSALGWWDWNLTTGQTYFDSSWKRMLGYEVEEIENNYQSWERLMHSQDRPRVMEVLNAYLRDALPRYEVEFRMRSKSGQWKWILIRGKVFDRDESGAPLRMLGTQKDISDRKLAEERLRHSQANLATAQKIAHIGNWEFDVLTGEITWSEEKFHILGLDPTQPEPNYTELIEKIYPDDLEPFQQATSQALALGKCYELDYRIVRPDGQVRYIEGRGEGVVNEQGQVIRLFGTALDITDRKRVEEALQESVQRERAIAFAIQRIRQTLDIETIFSATTEELRQLMNCDRVLIYRFNPDWSGEIVSESVGTEWISLLQEQANNPNLTQRTLENDNCAVKTFDSAAGCDSVLSTPSAVQDTYLQETEGGAYSRGASYAVVQDIYKAGFHSCYINFLERFQARAYIIVPIFCGSKLWGLLATYQNSGSRQWKVEETNVVVEIGNQLGVALQQAELLAQVQKQSEALRQSEAREREKAQALELALSELRNTQAQLIQTEKMSSLGRMIAGIAHEINNPISFIYGNLAPAKEYFEDLVRLMRLYQQQYPNPTSEIQQLAFEVDLEFLLADWSKLMDSMKVGAERINQIVLSLKSFSRLDESELKPVDIHEGIDNTLLILQNRLRAVGGRAEIKVIKNYGHLPHVTCYASQLNQVFLNVLNNAIDALENQSAPRVITISTSVSVYQQSVPNNKQQTTNNKQQITNFVIIRIADNGSGMSEEVRQQVFDPFFTTKSVGSGTGLGLSISHQIVVEKHQGRISCISAPEKGTELIVEIPVTCNREACEPQPNRKLLGCISMQAKIPECDRF
ncbi:MAG TPA: PAS domain-containing protein [Chroococcales cyanobacterium]